MSKTSQEWYDGIKNDPTKINDWLINQYHGEVTAAERIRELILCYTPPGNHTKWAELVELIATQEEQHAEWIAELLANRGLEAKKLIKDERYWDNTINQITDWDTGCAVAAHAEEMRLQRIRVICADSATAKDIKEVFDKILVQEEFHAKAFKEFTTDDAMQRTLEGHLAGLNQLGLKA